MPLPGGQQPSQVGLQAGVTYQYESDLSMLVPRAYPKFIKQFPSLASKNYIVLREAQGSGLYTPNKQFYQWTQRGKNIPIFQVLNSVASGTSSGTITLNPVYQFDNNTISPFGNGFFFVNNTTGQVVQLTNCVNTGGVTTATATTTDGSTLAIASTDWMQWKVTVVPEASNTQTTMVTIDQKVTNYCATIKTSQTFTDWSMFERLDIPPNPAGFDYIKIRQQADERDRFLYQQEDLLMFGKPMTNIAGLVNQHLGLMYNVIQNGSTDVASTLVNQAYFDNINRTIDAQGYSDEFDILLNIELRMKWENFIANVNTGGAFVYLNADAFKEGPAELNRTFKAYSFHGVKLNMKTYDYLSLANIAGGPPNTGLWNNSYLGIPRGDGVNPEDQTNVPRFVIRWQSVSPSMSPIKMRVTGGWAPVPTNDIENIVISTVATKGLQAFGINGYLFGQLATAA